MISALSGAYYAVGSVVHVSDINTQTNLLRIFSFCYKIWNNLDGNSFNGGHIYTSQQETIRLWMVHNPELHAEVYLKGFTGFMPN